MRNADVTRERILEAALAEFSAYGIAGARVDRIAKNAGCNKNLIYIYFQDKETLFTTVLQKHLSRVYEEVAFTPEDLPGYAARVFDYVMTHPELIRLQTWYGLETQADSLTERAAVVDRKTKAIMDAQSAGLVGTTFTPGFILTAILALAGAWTPTSPFGPSHDPEGVTRPSETRDAIAKAIHLITKGED